MTTAETMAWLLYLLLLFRAGNDKRLSYPSNIVSY